MTDFVERLDRCIAEALRLKERNEKLEHVAKASKELDEALRNDTPPKPQFKAWRLAMAYLELES